MAGHCQYTALLDACVLFPRAVCDSLLTVAETGIFAPKWSAAIDDEWMRSLAKVRDISKEKLEYRRDCMREAYPDWEVPEAAWQSLTPGLKLPDPGDVHVLAAALAGHADCIVTFNLKHFPPEVLGVYGIEAIHPDRFLLAQLDLDYNVVLPAFKLMRERLDNPRFTPEGFAEALERACLPGTADAMRAAAQLI